MDPRRKYGGQTVHRRGSLKDRCEPILLFEQRTSDLCTRSRDANQRGDVDRGCRSCGQRHGRREVSSIASRELEGKLRRFLTPELCTESSCPWRILKLAGFCAIRLFCYRNVKEIA